MLRPKVTRVSADRILRAVIISDIDDQSLCDLSDKINYTARVDDDNAMVVVVQRVRAIKPMSYRALIISTIRASDPRMPRKIYTLCSLDYKEIIN